MKYQSKRDLQMRPTYIKGDLHASVETDVLYIFTPLVLYEATRLPAKVSRSVLQVCRSVWWSQVCRTYRYVGLFGGALLFVSVVGLFSGSF